MAAGETWLSVTVTTWAPRSRPTIHDSQGLARVAGETEREDQVIGFQRDELGGDGIDAGRQHDGSRADVAQDDAEVQCQREGRAQADDVDAARAIEQVHRLVESLGWHMLRQVEQGLQFVAQHGIEEVGIVFGIGGQVVHQLLRADLHALGEFSPG